MPSKIKARGQTGITNTFKAKSKDCICNVCTCGTHSCKSKERSNITALSHDKDVKLEGISESKQQYIPRPLERTLPFKPPTVIPPNQPLEGDSTTHIEYKQHVLPEKYKKHVAKYDPSPYPLEGESVLHQDYKPWPVPEPPKKFKSQQYVKNDVKLDDSTETKSQFGAKPTPPRYVPPARKYAENPAKFEGSSESKDQYKAWPNQGVPTKFRTTEYKPNAAVFEGQSVTKSDYKQVSSERTMPLKKKEEYIPPSGPLQERSLYQDEFPPIADIHPPKKHQRPAPQFAAEDRDFSSTIHSSYVAYGNAERVKAIRPKQVVYDSAAPLEGTSSLRDDYKPFGLNDILANKRDLKAAALKDRQGQIPHGGEIATSSVYKDTFLPKTAPKTQPIRPAVQPVDMTRPLEGESELKKAYRNPLEVSKEGTKIYDHVNYKPVVEKRSLEDDRDFTTETKTVYTAKQCPASIAHGQKAEDGHVYVVKEGNVVNV